MTFDPATDRWPPTYDEEQLRRAISDLAGREDLSSKFYLASPPAAYQGVYQGDIVDVEAGAPILDESARPSIDGEFRYWLVIGNTCDFVREEVAWSQIVPIEHHGDEGSATQEVMAAFRRYQYARRFYIPPWGLVVERALLVADFLRPVAIHKAAFGSRARVLARMTYPAWALFHSCLVRFLARDDGRST